MADVLAVGPHPDDVELAAGGTVALLTAAGYRVVVLDLTRGERATRGTPAERAQEAARAASILGADRECLELPDTGLTADDPDQVAAVVSALRHHRPRLLLTLHADDDHPDHREGADLVERAWYLAGLAGYPGSSAPPFRPRRLLFAMGRRSFFPSLVVDVAPVYAKKREALGASASQFTRPPGDPRVTPISDPGVLARIEGRDRVHGGMIGTEFGEPFFSRDPWAVTAAGDLLGKE